MVVCILPADTQKERKENSIAATAAAAAAAAAAATSRFLHIFLFLCRSLARSLTLSLIIPLSNVLFVFNNGDTIVSFVFIVCR